MQNNIPVDVLLEIAKMEGENKIEISDFDAFILSEEIKEGPYVVYDWQLYWNYKQWSKKPISKRHFAILMNRKFKKKEKRVNARSNGRYYYTLNKEFTAPNEEKKANTRSTK